MPRATRPETVIVDWEPRYGDAFGRLNREWLDKYFRVEPVDEPAPKTMHALTRKIFQDQRVDASLIPIGDGLLLTRKL